MTPTRNAALLVFIAACGAPARVDEVPQTAPARIEPAPTPEPRSTPPSTPPAWAEHARIESNAGAYVVHVEPAPSTLPDNEAFELRVWVARADAPSELAREVRLAVDASMPEHGHGMNRTPKITREPSGEFLVQGMLFHMTGRWELYFDVTSGALTERAQVDVVLE